MKRTWQLIVPLAILWSGCGGSSGSTSTSTRPTVLSRAPNASLEAIDWKRELAYVPIAPSGAVDAEVAVLNPSASTLTPPIRG
jgi:hypothetical protein